MKFFTPALHARTCSANDKIAVAAHAEWERALTRYEKRLARIRSAFTPGVRRLIDELRLHDARLLYLGTCEDRCSLALQTDGDPPSIITLDYLLSGRPTTERNVLHRQLQTDERLFLYDEIDLATHKGKPIFSHSILFSNGLALRLKFHDVAVHVVHPLVELMAPLAQPA